MKYTRTVTGVVLAACATLASPTAEAHDYPVGSSPKNAQSITTQPGHVSVTFDDFVLTKPAAPDLVVIGPDGRHYETACATLANRTVSTTASLGPDGKYTATWRVVSADGHPVSDSIAFTFKASSGVKRATGQTAGHKCTSAAPETGGSSSTSSTQGPLIAAGAAGVGAVAAIAALLLRARRRPLHHEEDDQD